MIEDVNCKVVVCCHKKDIMATRKPYFPIQVGKSISNVDLGIQGDNSGDNISSKNTSYCELTGMYWAWKNLENVDVIGFCHYRRYFDFHKQCRRVFPYTTFPTPSFESVNIDIPDAIVERVQGGSVIVPEPTVYEHNLMADYCIWHISDDFRVLKQVISETQLPEYRDAFFKVFYQSNKLMSCNMFIMRWQDFDSYCSWLFPILAAVEDRIDITNYNSIQRRIYGYMAERLLNVWLTARQVKVSPAKVIVFNDISDPLSSYSSFSYWVRKRLNNLGMFFLKPRKQCK